MKTKTVYVFTTFLLVFAFVNSASASLNRKDYFQRPQVGIWFGPCTPMFETDEKLDTYLGGGAFFRYSTPFQLLKFGVDASYQVYPSLGVSEVSLVPVYGNLVFLLPINFPIRFQLKAGVGSSYVYLEPDKDGQWDPMFMLGFELSFPAGRTLNIGLRIDYLLVYEEYLDGATQNGHFINTGITLYMNW